ncbi:YcnI family protein [Mesorhizobium sp. M0815]|uniref:YcnI family copper-binding membrane protein n=1 Tax=unclassified Mesorhizobium TaxID=325217 RepID=UPI0033372FD1
MKKSLLPGCVLLVLGTSAAFAHITLETPEAAVGSTYKAVLRVPHGCEGKAMTALRVQIPEGVLSVKPMPKPGWTLQVKNGKYEKSYQLYGQAVTSGVKEVDWSAGSLPDEFYDEFVFRTTLASDLPAGQTLHFPVVQECDGVADRWIEIPAVGQAEDALEFPAPGLKLLPKK